MITQSTDGSVLLNWIARRGNDNTMTFTCLTSGGAAFSLVGYTITADLYRFGTSNSIMSGTVSNGGATGIFTVTYTATQTNTLNAPDIFFGRIRVTHPDTTVHEWFNIQFVLNTELYDGSVTSSVSATVNVGTTNITTTINPGGKIVDALIIACSDETTALTTGTAKVSFRMPYALTLTSVRANLVTAQTSGSIFTVNVKKNGTTVFSTKPTIDNTETSTQTAATPSILSTTALADDDLITVDIDQIGGGTAKGLKIALIGTR